MLFGVKFFDEADELEGAGSGAAVAEAEAPEQRQEKRTPFGESEAMSDDEFEREKARALKQIGRAPSNVDVGLDGKVTPTPKTPEAPKVKAEAPVEKKPASKLSKDVLEQLKDGYGIGSEEIEDFDDDADAIRFMTRIDKRQSKVIAEERLLREAEENKQKPKQDEEESPVEKRTIRKSVDDTQREIDRSRGVESQAEEVPATPEQYQEYLTERTVGKLKKLGYEPEFIEVMQDVLGHLFFQDKHLREAYSAISGLTHRQVVSDQERAKNDADRFINLVDTHIGDASLFGSTEKRTGEQWDNLKKVFGILNDLLSRRSDKTVSPALVTRAVSLAFEGKVKTRAEKLKDQSSLRMGTSSSRTVGRNPGNREQYKNDRVSHPLVAQKIAEIEKKLREGD